MHDAAEPRPLRLLAILVAARLIADHSRDRIFPFLGRRGDFDERSPTDRPIVNMERPLAGIRNVFGRSARLGDSRVDQV